MASYGTIVGTGRYLPEIEVSNDVLRKQLAHVPDFVDKMEKGTGILRRWHAPENWATSDVALPAARQALERAGRKPEDVDLIILGTDSPDYITPSTSVVLQLADNVVEEEVGNARVARIEYRFPNFARLLAVGRRHGTGQGDRHAADRHPRRSRAPRAQGAEWHRPSRFTTRPDRPHAARGDGEIPVRRIARVVLVPVSGSHTLWSQRAVCKPAVNRRVVGSSPT